MSDKASNEVDTEIEKQSQPSKTGFTHPMVPDKLTDVSEGVPVRANKSTKDSDNIAN